MITTYSDLKKSSFFGKTMETNCPVVCFLPVFVSWLLFHHHRFVNLSKWMPRNIINNDGDIRIDDDYYENLVRQCLHSNQ